MGAGTHPAGCMMSAGRSQLQLDVTVHLLSFCQLTLFSLRLIWHYSLYMNTCLD